MCKDAKRLKLCHERENGSKRRDVHESRIMTNEFYIPRVGNCNQQNTILRVRLAKSDS
jgi:hypothetical protein